MTHYLLKQYGARPLQFDGDSLVSATQHCKLSGLYCEIEIYTKSTGGYVARLLVDDDLDRDAGSLPSPTEIQFVKETSTENEVLKFFRDFPMCDFAPGLSFEDLDDQDPEAIDGCYATLADHLKSIEDEYLSFIATTFPGEDPSQTPPQSFRTQEF